MKRKAESIASKPVVDLLYQVLETELGGVEVYSKALECVTEKGLVKELTKYLKQTRTHVEIATTMLSALGLDPNARHPSRKLVKIMGEALVEMMNLALADGPEAAQLTACECVVHAETKDHANWELLAELAKSVDAASAKIIKASVAEVEDQEDEHLYHSQGWARELALRSLGAPSVIPPPEERKDVKTAIGAARAKQARHPHRAKASARAANGSA